MATILYHLEACTDCVLYVANGDTPDDNPNLPAAIDAWLGLEAGQHLVNAGDDDSADEFSWRACECCGSRLGGARDRLAVLSCT